MGQCLGPCVYEVDSSIYMQMEEAVTRFLNGDTKEIKDDLKKKMMQASSELAFEKAAEYKRLIDSIDQVVDKQMIEMDKKGSKDAFAYYVNKGYIAIAGFLVRNGTILSKEYRLRPLYDAPEDTFINFIVQYYDEHPKASELVLPNGIETSTLEEVLDMKIFLPQKGYRQKLIDMCVDNAKKQLEQKFEVAEKQDTEIEKAVEQLSSLARHTMNRVELFDNSHISGQFTVAACVVYEDGYPQKKDYRLYKLHTGNSDFDSMKEVIYRRYFRLLSENGRMPDGIIVDGGELQIHAAKEIIDSLGIDIKIMGLVKDDHHNTNALMNENGETFAIDKDSGLFFLLTRMQDEVHRVAITYHRKLRSKAQTKSILDEIEGIGPKRKKLLLKTFGSFTNLKAVSIEEIAKVVPNDTALKVYEAIHMQE